MSRTPRLTPGIAVPPLAARLLPFLRWFPLRPGQLRADVVAGITVALVLVPQSMAYAALAGLPVVYGLYAAFVPVLIGALWGSSNHLHTGPVAMISLMSAAALVPFAAVGSPEFVGLSLMLAMLVGAICLALGLLRLGVLVNFLSHPVTIGFTNAAAIIIGLSLLNRILNVPMPRSDRFLHDMWVTVSQIGHAHLPTVLFGARGRRAPVGLAALPAAGAGGAGGGRDRDDRELADRLRAQRPGRARGDRRSAGPRPGR
ncbi:MAG: SulP family inorganic anion transporter [Chromatiales bacterium]|nr:SulP family inorganic anion transporter [Chromatiales bacterium]